MAFEAAGRGRPQPLRWATLEAPARPARRRPPHGGAAGPGGAAEGEARPEGAGEQAQPQAEAARAQARELLDRARGEAEALRAQAEEAGRAEGLAAGREQGLAEGRRAAQDENAALRAEAERLVRQAREDRGRVLQALAGDVAALALDVARQVLQREVEQSPEDVVALARRLLQRVDSPAVLRAHPSLAPVLEAEAPGLGGAVSVRADRGVAPGGLVLESEEGVLDATVDGRLQRVARAVQEAAADGR